jgi:hypothetical protein
VPTGLDQPASSQALWALYDVTGVRVEYLVPVLSAESGLNPSVPNAAGYPYYGINQMSGSWLSAAGITPSDYLTWPASQQIAAVVTPYMAGIVKQFGRLHSGTRVYQANFYPASLKTARTLASKIVCSPSQAYTANAGLDVNRSGCIEVSDLAATVQKQAATSGVQAAIAAAYALRPGEKERNPVYGTDSFGALSKTQTALAVGAIVAGGGALAWSLAGNPWPPWQK